jgi:hypothetical protein
MEDKMSETNELVYETMLRLYGEDRSGRLLRFFITKLIAISKLKGYGIDDENKLYVVTKDEYERLKENKDMSAKIYSIFPACGKTWLYEHQEDYGLKILDSDSSQFSWECRKRTEEELRELRIKWDSVPHLLSGQQYINSIKDEIIKARNPNFPANYIQHIKENISKYDYIFVSSHKAVREALDSEGIDYTIVHPGVDCKAEWIGRCYLREKNGESGCTADVLYNNWEQWLIECYETGVTHREVVLQPGEHVSDIFKVVV